MVAAPGHIAGSNPDGERWRRASFAVGVVGASASALVAMLSFAPVVPPLPGAIWGILFAGTFPLHARTVLVLRRRQGSLAQGLAGAAGSDFDVARRYWWLGPACGLAVVTFLTSIPSLRGQPTIVHGGFFLDDHGSLIRVSHDAYLQALAAQERLFTGISCAFYSFAVAINHRGGDGGA